VQADVGGTVLVLDEDDDIRVVLRELLEDEGYTVADVATTSAALSYLREATECVVLFDFHLAQEKGSALLRAVERDSDLHRHRYVLLTGMAVRYFPEEDRQLADAYCTAIVCKPPDVDMLLQVVAGARGTP
jgi:CheY-like chemotaxis protein